MPGNAEPVTLGRVIAALVDLERCACTSEAAMVSLKLIAATLYPDDSVRRNPAMLHAGESVNGTVITEETSRIFRLLADEADWHSDVDSHRICPLPDIKDAIRGSLMLVMSGICEDGYFCGWMPRLAEVISMLRPGDDFGTLTVTERQVALLSALSIGSGGWWGNYGPGPEDGPAFCDMDIFQADGPTSSRAP